VGKGNCNRKSDIFGEQIPEEMIRKDYIMKIIEQFFDVLKKLIKNEENQDIEDIRVQLNELYNTYFKKNYKYFYDSDFEEIVDFLNSDNSGDNLYKTEMLAELIYQDTCLKQDVDLRKSLLSKSFRLFEYLDKEGKTFSLERYKKMQVIKKEVSLLSD